MPGLQVFIVFVLALAGTVGCGEKKKAQPTKGSSQPNEKSPNLGDKRFTEVDKVALMEQHYTAAIVAHDMLIRGDLEQFRSKLTLLSGQELPSNAPEAWRAPHDRMRGAAKAAGGATTLDAAGPGMASVVQTCGECHAANPLGPVYQKPKAPDGEGVDAKMQNHQWASERLWEGITGPSGDAWLRGAAALAESRVFDDGRTTGALVELEGAMRSLGEEAKGATTLAGRATLYGTLLSTCGACHQQLSVNFESPDPG